MSKHLQRVADIEQQLANRVRAEFHEWLGTLDPDQEKSFWAFMWPYLRDHGMAPYSPISPFDLPREGKIAYLAELKSALLMLEQSLSQPWLRSKQNALDALFIKRVNEWRSAQETKSESK